MLSPVIDDFRDDGVLITTVTFRQGGASDSERTVQRQPSIQEGGE